MIRNKNIGALPFTGNAPFFCLLWIILLYQLFCLSEFNNMPFILPDDPHCLTAEEVYQPFPACDPAVLCQHRAELALVEQMVYCGVGAFIKLR